MTRLYHTDVFIPAELRARAEQTNFENLVWSRHAQLELVNDPYSMISASEIPLAFEALGWTLIELETTDEKITKYVFRRSVDTRRSLVIVLRETGVGIATVVTAWTNLNADKHATLDRSKYATC